MEIANRIKELPPYLFVTISKKIAEKKAVGEEVISFGIGDPDMPTPGAILDSICEYSRQPANHRYPESEGLPELRQAMAEWYQQRFGVQLDPETEVLPLIGSKEGIAHIAWCMLNPGDVALVPDPSYPVYGISTLLADAQAFNLPLKPENDYLPQYESIPDDIKHKAKLLWLNYPNNPTGAVADISFFERSVQFAMDNGIAVCHDAPYTEIAFDGFKPPSFLQATGAKEVGIEFHSFSKSYNMSGWRIGMAVGNSTMIDALKRFKSNVDSGIPQAIQLAAIKALKTPQEVISRTLGIYQKRRDLIVETLKDMGLEVTSPKASLYVWARVPAGYTSASFATELLDKVGVVVTPGNGYGSNGEGFIRLSLTVPDASLVKGLSKLATWNGIRKSK
ncbi:LL-diaminopimelate aminotransferase [Dehalogenimonas lykanthroporepellens BL-DC-9]|jgi:LL-diaminopimelate aminotransferase|nr:LL-diaminopimelate aminotransferase [Dehalogenimonas lykanthroporepellens BL-DC-9]